MQVLADSEGTLEGIGQHLHVDNCHRDGIKAG